MQPSYTLQMVVVIVTALAGTGFAVSLILLWFSLGGEQQFVTMSLIYTVASGVIMVIGVILLMVTKPPQDEDQSQE
jgi:hypothetical protein